MPATGREPGTIPQVPGGSQPRELCNALDKQAFKMTLQESPSYMDCPSFRLMCLRSTHFDVLKADAAMIYAILKTRDDF
jgi:hypothetical protein